MFRGKTVQEQFRLTKTFDRPVLSWANLPQEFFEAIFSKLGDTLRIRPSDFSAAPSFSPGDLNATFRIFGGASTITLTAENLVLHFPNLPEDQYQLAVDTYFASSDAVASILPRAVYKTLLVQNTQHMDLVEGGKFKNFISGFSIDRLSDHYQQIDYGTFEQGIKYFFSSSDHSWSMQFQLEKSLAIANGIFTSLDIVINDLEKYDTPQAELDLVVLANKLAMESIGVSVEV